MRKDQFKLLNSLAKSIKNEKKDVKVITTSLHSAKILTKTGKFTSHFSHLEQVASPAK